MKVPLLDLRAQYLALESELRAAIEGVMSSQQFILGAEVNRLEEEIARYSQAKYAVGCASGSDALLLALMALGIGEGDEVITTPYSFFATASAITRTGARPVFVDIDPKTYNISAALVRGAISPRTRAVMPVHLFGQCARMEEIQDVAANHGLAVIEDAAQAIGAEDEGKRRAGSLGVIGCFSFYPTKNLGAAGDAGMLTTNDEGLAKRLRIFRVHGGETRYHHSVIGINSRLDAIQAAILRVKFPHLDEWSDLRARNAERYDRLLLDAGVTERVGLPFKRAGVRHIYNQYVIRVRGGGERDSLRAYLSERGVSTEVYYPVPLHLQECFRYLGHEEGDFPEAERAARETLALPIYPELTFEQQQYVVDSIRRFFT